MPNAECSLFTALMKEAPAQPATNLWRAFELSALIDFAMPRLRDCRVVLDLGCGDGGVMAALRSHLPPEARFIGIDADPLETTLAGKRGFYEKIVTGGAEKMPLPDASVDAVISNSVLEHVDPINAVLKEAARVLRPGGRFIATVPGPDFHRCLAGPWLPWVGREKYIRDLDKRLAHLRYWTKDEWQSHLSAANIELIEAMDYLPLGVVRRWELISRLTGGLLYHLALKKTPPIGLQRRLGLRKFFSIPQGVVDIAARILCAGLDKAAQEPQGGLLLMGRRT